jgi:hypothetical protein
MEKEIVTPTEAIIDKEPEVTIMKQIEDEKED